MASLPCEKRRKVTEPRYPRAGCSYMGIAALVTFLMVLLGATLWWSIALWNADGPAEMSGHGYVAMTLGIVFSMIVGIGLMALVFYSARKGYDRPAERERQK